MTRAERYKRNYRKIKNTYQDTKLAKQAQTWSDERLYTELGIKAEGATPELRTIEPEQQSRYKRKLEKFKFARDIGLDVDVAKKVTKYKKEKIINTHAYLQARATSDTNKNRIIRMDLWADWSGIRGDMPPLVEKEARQINRETIIGGKRLDDYAKYGYIVAFYMFVENKSQDEIDDLVKPDPHDSYRVHYRTVVKA